MARVSALFVFSMLILACGFDFGTARELPLKGVYSKLWRFQLNNRCVRGTGGRLLHDSRDVQLRYWAHNCQAPIRMPNLVPNAS